MRRRTPDRPSAAPSRTAGAPSQRAGAGAATLAAVVILAAAMAACDRPEPVRATLSVSETLAMADTTGFRRAVEPRAFTFP
ncbi:MAG TPA: hypothetical protein VK966_11265, partial [Longimicrobiales bacterium]|nr:hypothetical protein [Longimicrobiales bacterium]